MSLRVIVTRLLKHSDKVIEERYRLVKSLLPHYRHHSSQELRCLIIHSITAARILLPLAPSKSIDKVASRILLHACQLKSNVYGITDLTSDARDVRQERIASAVYPICSLFNHSCDPNTSLFFDGVTLTIRASREIVTGIEVTNCYGPHYTKMKKEERQAILKQQYCFECHCSACMREAVQDSDFKCQNECECVLKGGAGSDLLLCSLCGATASRSELERVLSMSNQFYSKGRSFLSEKEVEKAYQAFKHAYNFRCKVFHLHHKSVAEVEDAMAESAALMGKFGDAADHVENSIRALRRLFGVEKNSPSEIAVLELGHEYFKLAQLSFNARRVELAFSSIGMARTILLNCVGGSATNAPKHIREELEEMNEMESYLRVVITRDKSKRKT